LHRSARPTVPLSARSPAATGRLRNLVPAQANLDVALARQQALYAEAAVERSNRAYDWVRK
jgi:hypothetical protein